MTRWVRGIFRWLIWNYARRVDMTFACVWVTHLYVWHDSSGGCPCREQRQEKLNCDTFICVPWRIEMCDTTYSYVWCDLFVSVTWLLYVCDMTRLYVWHDSSDGYPCRKCKHNTLNSFLLFVCQISWCVWNNSFICVGSPIYFMWHDSFTCVTWLNRWMLVLKMETGFP